MKKFLKWTAIVLGGLVGLTILAGLVLYPIGVQKLNQLYPDIPAENLTIPTGSDAVARGRHIATIWSCTKCHGENLSGSLLIDDAILGTIPAANLTSGDGGVAGSYSDADWIRAIRHGVKPDNRGEIFMNNYAALGDQDLGDLIAYLKQIPPVDTHYPALRYGPVIPIVTALGLYPPAAEQIDHTAPRPADPAPGETVEYGRYLYAACTECHTTRLARNLEGWNQDDFVRAMKTGVLPDGDQLGASMSPKTYGELNETELTALWLYLKSLPTQKSQ